MSIKNFPRSGFRWILDMLLSIRFCFIWHKNFFYTNFFPVQPFNSQTIVAILSAIFLLVILSCYILLCLVTAFNGNDDDEVINSHRIMIVFRKAAVKFVC